MLLIESGHLFFVTLFPFQASTRPNTRLTSVISVDMLVVINLLPYLFSWFEVGMRQDPSSSSPQRASTFVAPNPPCAVLPGAVEIVETDPYEIRVPMPAVTTSQVTGTYVDRARAFRVAVTPLCFVAGALGAIVAVAGLSVPILSIAVLGWFFTWFGAVWLIAWLLSLVISADGVALFQAWSIHRILRSEQKERIKRYTRSK